MDNIRRAWSWLVVNWGLIIVVVIPLVAKVLNRLTVHYSERRGLVRFCLFILDLLDIVKSTPPPIGGKGTTIPGGGPVVSGIIGALVAGSLVLIGGCSTVDALGKIQAAGASVRQAATPILDAKCETAAKACPQGKASDCKPLVECWTLRRSFYAATDAVQVAVAGGLAADAAQQGVKGWIAKATAAIQELLRFATKEGLL